MSKRIISFTILIVGLSLIINLSRDIWRLSKSGNQIKVAQEKAKTLEKEHQDLLEKQKYYQSDEFVEEEARNKLGMSKPGETVVILPPNLSQVLGHSQAQALPEIPNWQQWWQLFF